MATQDQITELLSSAGVSTKGTNINIEGANLKKAKTPLIIIAG